MRAKRIRLAAKRIPLAAKRISYHTGIPSCGPESKCCASIRAAKGAGDDSARWGDSEPICVYK